MGEIVRREGGGGREIVRKEGGREEGERDSEKRGR